MAQIFVSAGHGGYEDGMLDPGYVLGSTTEAAQMKTLRDMVLAELRTQGYNAEPVPNDLSAAQTITYINERCKPTDVALELHVGAFPDTSVRGAAVFYVVNNEARKNQAELLLNNLLQAVPQLTNRGVKPDTEFSSGSSAFSRQIGCPSLLMEVIVITNPDDLALLQNQQRDFAIGIANGLKLWSNLVDTEQVSGDYPPVAITVNGRAYPDPGIIIDDRSYLPIDVVGVLGLDLAQLTDVQRVRYGDQVYIRAADLKNYNVKVEWQASTRTVFLQSEVQLAFCPGRADLIMGRGATTETKLAAFLATINPAAANQYRDLPRLYREEASIEGVNYDIAFCQMLVETDELTNTQVLNVNNFGGLASATGGTSGAGFPNRQTGVRAQIQHLKAYGSVEPLVQRLVDPRFDFVRRGVAPLVHMLTGKWNSEPDYGDKIMGYVRRLYGSGQV
jgi:hypothetical protein